MTNIIIGIIIGMVVWQLVVTIIAVSTDFDNEIANNIMCGVWAILFYTIIKPIYLIISLIYSCYYYSKYLRCEFYDDDFQLVFYVEKQLTKMFETSPDKQIHVEIKKEKAKIYFPYCDRVITKEKIKMHPEKYEFLNKWKKVD